MLAHDSYEPVTMITTCHELHGFKLYAQFPRLASIKRTQAGRPPLRALTAAMQKIYGNPLDGGPDKAAEHQPFFGKGFWAFAHAENIWFLHRLAIVCNIDLRRTPRIKRAAIYARVSTDGQTTDNQVMALREIAGRRGWRSFR